MLKIPCDIKKVMYINNKPKPSFQVITFLSMKSIAIKTEVIINIALVEYNARLIFIGLISAASPSIRVIFTTTLPRISPKPISL